MRAPFFLAGLTLASSASSPLLPSDITNEVLQSIVGTESIGANGTAVNLAAGLQNKTDLGKAPEPAAVLTAQWAEKAEKSETSAAQKLAAFKQAAEETWLNKEKAVKEHARKVRSRTAERRKKTQAAAKACRCACPMRR